MFPTLAHENNKNNTREENGMQKRMKMKNKVGTKLRSKKNISVMATWHIIAKSGNIAGVVDYG